MENRISIDEMFHKGLHDGKEQMNLGAWANMERLLDGKNPYEEKGKQKRRFFPFLWIALAGVGLLSAGYFVKNKSMFFAHTPKVQAPSSTFDVVSASKNTSAIPTALCTKPTKKEQASVFPADQQITEKANAATKAIPKKVASNVKSQTYSAPISTTNASMVNAVSSFTTKADLPKVKNEKIKTNTNRISNHASNRNAIAKNSSNQTTAFDKLSDSPAMDNLENSSMPTAADEKEAMQNAASTSIEKIPMVELTQKTILNRDGSVQENQIDTIRESVFEKQSNQYATASISVDPSITNPRYKKLSEEEEMDANRMQVSTPENIAAASASPVLSESMVQKKTSSILQTTNKSKHTNQSSFIDNFRNFTKATFDKINNFLVNGVRPNLYTGMSMGFNNSLNSQKNNFGGFQAGLNAFYPLSRSITLMTEAKYFFRNNGGYTTSGINKRLVDASTDNVSLGHLTQTIYSYQIDSTIRTYNFKTFQSIELPIMVQYNYRSISVYGGLNFAYNFKLKLNEKDRSYSIQKRDTLPSSLPYTFPVSQSSQIQSSDFRSRFGIGYTFGTAYSFSPNLYIDLRVTQNVWDQMKALSEKEISNGYFKIPSIQLSLGYRFKKYTPDN